MPRELEWQSPKLLPWFSRGSSPRRGTVLALHTRSGTGVRSYRIFRGSSPRQGTRSFPCMETKHCTTCGLHKPVEEFSAKRSSRDGFQAKCKTCLSEYHRNHYQQNKDVLRPQIRETSRRRRRSIRAWIDDIKSCGCQLCPEDDICCLDFHHLLSEEKELTISVAMHANSVVKVLEEINKCVVLCRNCHSKVHAGRKTCDGLPLLRVEHLPEGMQPRTVSKTRSKTIKATREAKDGLRPVLR